MTKAGIAATALVVVAAAGIAGAWYTGTRLEGVLLDSIEQGAPACHETVPFEVLSRESVRSITK